MVEISLPYRLDLTQQHGYLHAGIVTTIADSACGYAAYTLMPPNSEVLSVEFKVNLLRPAKGESFVAVAEVVKPGKCNPPSRSWLHSPDSAKDTRPVRGTADDFLRTKAAPRIGNRMMLKNIPVSTQVYNIELTAGKGAQICRSAGTYATVLGTDGNMTMLRLMSGEVRKVAADNYASIGVVSNIDHSKVIVGKAGRKRHMGIKPTVLGKSKNPNDHPHGGGEGHTSVGLKYPKTPWGAPALGRRTRNKKKPSSKLILSRRKK
jgi:ribosomal protein L2